MLNSFFNWLASLFGNARWSVVFGIFFVVGMIALVFVLSPVAEMDRDGPWYDDQIYSFAYGDINDKGRVQDVKNALYTKDMIKCDTIRITYAFGADYFFEIHYFTEDDTWIGGDVVTTSDVYTYNTADMPVLTKDDGTAVPCAGFRIVLRSNDGEDIGIFRKMSARKCLTIDVYREAASDDAVLQFSLPAARIRAAAA